MTENSTEVVENAVKGPENIIHVQEKSVNQKINRKSEIFVSESRKFGRNSGLTQPSRATIIRFTEM
ncbi:MAG TPA: hypothetical protein PKA90_15640 [Ignavibacteria bacterium]|nr:hypothetical protein [Ignavibacteria bacterium]HMR41851.1 hypothetical protein [Ignavibacteria bacterium]